MSQVQVTVKNIHPSFLTAYAEDGAGQRVLLNGATRGLSFKTLRVGQVLRVEVNERNYAVAIEEAA